MKRRIFLLCAAALVFATGVIAQQVPDRTYRPPVTSPAYASGEGPVVCVDEAHANFHTLSERFWAFGELLRRDGYVPRPFSKKFSSSSLRECGILVISNAQPNRNEWDTYPYPTPSAFTRDEVEATARWVRDGGNLLLIADHMPMAGAAASLAAAFDVTFTDGFAVDGYSTESERDTAMAKPTMFRTDDNTLESHAIVRGRSTTEAVTSVRTFTGQAFRAPASAERLLVLPSTFIVLMPEKAWQFSPETRRMPAGGWLQGAVMPVASGRAAFFGEAAMFSAQVTGANRRPMGMNAPGAEQNFQFVLNLLHWLSRLI
jgi:hypothetical protein